MAHNQGGRITPLGEFDRSISGNAADPARIPGKTGGKVTGYDYSINPDNDDALCDDELGSGTLIVENAFGGPYGDGANRGPGE